MPKPDASLSAVVVSGGKQYRVTPGDRILVDRLAAEPGSSVKVGRVLLLVEGEGVKVAKDELQSVEVDAKVLAHERGPRTESIRYKSKKRVRVHRGGRSFLTVLEIIAVGGVGVAPDKEPESQTAPPKGRAKKAAPKRKAEPAKAVAEAQPPPEAAADKPKRRRSKKEEK